MSLIEVITNKKHLVRFADYIGGLKIYQDGNVKVKILTYARSGMTKTAKGKPITVRIADIVGVNLD
jgi:hypothetical protein